MKYETINPDTWKRRELFRYYIDNLRNVMSLTADTDVTRLVGFVRAHGLKFYPAMIWVVSKAVNSREEFRYGWDGDGNPIRWDFVSPYYADFHKEDECCVKLVTEYSDDLYDFHARLSQTEKSIEIFGASRRKTYRPTPSTYPVFRG